MYTYNVLLTDLPLLERKGAEICHIGASVSGRMIPMIHVGGHAGKQILIQGAIHAREHITAKLVVMQIYYLLTDGDKGVSAVRKERFLAKGTYLNVRDQAENPFFRDDHAPFAPSGGIYFIPMSNPDGVSLCQFGLDSVSKSGCKRKLLEINGGSSDFSLWKANLNAVDLNCNFPARWGTGAQNVTAPAPESYIGPAPESEPETRALTGITAKINPALTISYHCKGREIYWQFHQTGERLSRDKKIAEAFAKETGYALIDGDRGSAGGYKDWCIERFKIPAYTFEAIDDNYQHPVPYSALAEEYPLNKDIPLLALECCHC